MSDSDTDSEQNEKERVRSRKSLLNSTVKRKKSSHALLERFERVKTPSHTPHVWNIEEVEERRVAMEKMIESLKEESKKNAAKLEAIEKRLNEDKQKIDESCCIGYCTIL